MPAKMKLSAIFIATIVVLFAVNNSIYYFSTKSLLTDELDERMESVARQIRISIDQASYGATFMEALMAENLRAASIAIQHRLDADYNQVSNQELLELRELLDVDNITLFAQVEGDIVGVRSTDHREVGLSTKDWNWWFDAFQQLFQLEPVQVGRGQTLPHYWSGPFEISTSDPRNIEKWGYYFDGRTNYIIDPYITYDRMDEYLAEVGPPAVIAKLIAENAFLKEITVFNYDKFGAEPKMSVNANNETWLHFERRPILFGTYEFGDVERDLAAVKEAMTEGSIVSYVADAQNYSLYKSYIPVTDAQTPYVIGVVSDYGVIQSKLDRQFRYVGFTIVAASLLTAVFSVLVIRFVRRKKDSAVQKTQETYIHNVNDLFTAIRGQRHDFLNQVQTIHTMAAMGKLKELQLFTRELIGDISEIDDIIRIGNPAVAALVKAKLVAALDKKICFTYQIDDLQEVKLGVKSVDIVRIIGNLLDNAIDEAVLLPEEERRIRLEMYEEDEYLHVLVSNPGQPATGGEIEQWFSSGYTSRRDGRHQGIGLAVTRERVLHYNGTIRATYDEENGIVVEVSIPLH